jgi:type II secretory pathway component PulF
MPTFTYKSLDLNGQDVTGQLEAPSRADLVRELAARGLSVTDIAESTAAALPWLARSGGEQRIRVRPKPLAALTRQLATSLEAGLPLTSALDVIGQELDHAASRELLKELRRRVQEGASFSDALAEYPQVFSPMYVRLVRVGETGGMLDEVLTQLADMLERQTELRERVKTASIYPAIVLLLGLASVVVIVSFIVPRIIESIGAEPDMLPWPTRVLMGLSGFFGSYWWLLTLLVVAGVVGWRQLVLRGAGRPKWDAAKLRIPLLGRLIRQLEAGRFARSMGMLTHRGVAITEALAVARDTIQNTLMREAVEDLGEAIQAGESIARPLQRCGLFPPLLVQMIRVGESTGRLGEMLLRAAHVHEGEARVTLDRFVSVLPVVMILLLACVVGFIVAGLVLAIVEFQTTGMGALAG